jgi:hypothetical protein
MNVFLFSTFTLFTELLVTAAVLYIFFDRYKKDKFHPSYCFSLLSTKRYLNINYMAHRTSSVETAKMAPWHIALAAFHGIFSLLMFITLVIFFILAWLNFRKDINYFKKHATFSKIFIVSWLISITSGIIFYVITYL